MFTPDKVPTSSYLKYRREGRKGEIGNVVPKAFFLGEGGREKGGGGGEEEKGRGGRRGGGGGG